MRNQLQTYFLPDDESALSDKLRQLSRSVFFVDHDAARSAEVELHLSINACRSGFAYIWDAETVDTAIAMQRWNEIVLLNRNNGSLVQFLRSRVSTEELVDGKSVELLLSGRVAMMGESTERQKNLKSLVYKAISSIATAEVFSVSPATREVVGPKQLGARVGFHAAQWCSDPLHLLRHAGTRIGYGLPALCKAK